MKKKKYYFALKEFVVIWVLESAGIHCLPERVFTSQARLSYLESTSQFRKRFICYQRRVYLTRFTENLQLQNYQYTHTNKPLAYRRKRSNRPIDRGAFCLFDMCISC